MTRPLVQLALLIVALGAADAVQAAHAVKPCTGCRKVEPFDLRRVRLLDGPFRDALERNRQYLVSLDNDRLLHTFRQAAGLPSSAKPLGGWENPSRSGPFGGMACGQFLGHYLSACALMHASTGDEKLKAKAVGVVAELARCQAALGPRGYLHTLRESDFDRLEAGEAIWGNYYTIHKLLAGLLDVSAYIGDDRALEVATRLAGWVERRTRGQSVELFARTWHRDLHVEYGGLNEALVNLYAVTGDPRILATAKRFDDEGLYRPLAEGRDELAGLHVNTQIPKIIGAARTYELTGEPRYRRIAEFFWRQVALHRSYATGGTSNYELWRGEPDKLARELSPATQECCCTYNLLKLTRHVFFWNADPQAADFYERGLFNGVLGTQNPETGMTMYYVPLASGYWKTFASPMDSFWCCTGTGIESFAKFGDSIYFHDQEGLWVNLFIASELSWPERHVVVRQETRFPEQEGTSLRFAAAQPVEMAVRVRIPYWAGHGATIRLNGSPLSVLAKPGSYAILRRTWRDGDRLDIVLPMGLHLHPMPDDPTVVAVMYGPLVLAGRLGTQGPAPEQLRAATPAPQGKPAAAPWFVADGDDPSAWIRPVAGRPLEFRTVGQSVDVTLVPLCRLFGECYAVYWNVYRRGSPAHQARLADDRRRARRAARTVDAVEIGDPSSESQHDFRGERTESGAGGAGRWRHATAGGWFSYRLKVPADTPTVLCCTYWGGDTPPRRFDILIDGTPIATQELDRNRPGEFFDVEYPVPPELTRGKSQITVRFQARPGNIAGGVFGLALLRRDD
ncbi:MAG: glycoside hydrolase family 127 protein [Thermoguttaceae bacterium]|jgi:DUF1680 family protein|nr:glycoside hydrolase family 127 protein [Thermoguttaceae bacterium]